jgi:predicted DNA binding CopG/RHH family protein
MKKELNPNQELDASEKDKLYRFRKFLSEKGDEKSNSLFLEYLKEFPIALRHKDHFDFDFSAFLEFVKNTENPTDQKQAFCLILDPDFTFYVDHNARTNYAIKNDCIVEFIRLMEEAISSTSEKKAGRPKLQEPEKLTERVNLRFSEAEYQKLEQQALKQHLPVTTFARKLVLDALATVQPDNAP